MATSDQYVILHKISPVLVFGDFVMPASYSCLCKACGSTKLVRGDEKGFVHICNGTLPVEPVYDKPTWEVPKGFSTSFKDYLRRKKDSMAKRTLACELTVGEILWLISLPCAYCGNAAKNGISQIDRVDTTKGYVPGNVVPCCARCNSSKRDHPISYFLERLPVVYWP